MPAATSRRSAEKDKRVNPRKRRLSSDDRRAHILTEATKFFAEHGFEANTRLLAQQLGTTQPLLYRYFASKDALIQAVLEQMFERQAGHDWQDILTARDRPLRDRLIDFALAYAMRTYDHDWIRLYMFAGLAGGDFNRRYIAAVTEPLLRAIALEIRAELPDCELAEHTIGRREIDYLWLFHGGLYYQAIRRHIYGIDIDEAAMRELIGLSVDMLVQGMRKLLTVNRSSRQKSADA